MADTIDPVHLHVTIGVPFGALSCGYVLSLPVSSKDANLITDAVSRGAICACGGTECFTVCESITDLENKFF